MRFFFYLCMYVFFLIYLLVLFLMYWFMHVLMCINNIFIYIHMLVSTFTSVLVLLWQLYLVTGRWEVYLVLRLCECMVCLCVCVCIDVYMSVCPGHFFVCPLLLARIPVLVSSFFPVFVSFFLLLQDLSFSFYYFFVWCLVCLRARFLSYILAWLPFVMFGCPFFKTYSG